MQPERDQVRSDLLECREVDPQDSTCAEEETPGDLLPVRGGRIVDPLGVVHLIISVVHNQDGDPMFIGTTCAPRLEYIGKHSRATLDPPTCLACATGKQDLAYTRWLAQVVEGPAIAARRGASAGVRSKL